jgi:hypothetical protein
VPRLVDGLEHLLEVDVLAHRDATHLALGRRAGRAALRNGHADAMQPRFADFVGPDVARIEDLPPHPSGRRLDHDAAFHMHDVVTQREVRLERGDYERKERDPEQRLLRPVRESADRAHEKTGHTAQESKERHDEDGADHPLDHDQQRADDEQAVGQHAGAEVVVPAAPRGALGDVDGDGADQDRREEYERAGHHIQIRQQARAVRNAPRNARQRPRQDGPERTKGNVHSKRALGAGHRTS